MLGELVEERVILRRLQSGRRPGWCEVNPDVAAWRAVAWAHDPATIEARVALHEKRLRDTSTALERLVSRPIGATQPDLVARLIAARLAPDVTPLSRADEARHNGLSVAACRAPMGRDTLNSLSRAHGRGTTSGRPPAVPYSGQDPNRVVVDGDGASAEQPAAERIEVDEAALTEMRRLILARAVPGIGGRKFVNGRPLVELTALVARYPLERLRAVLDEAPAGEQVPGLVRWMADNAEPPPELEPPAPVDEGRRLANRAAVLESQVIALRRQAEQCDAEGAPEVGDSYRAELSECENELAGVMELLTMEAVR